MNKILSALLVGFFALSINAFAADAAPAPAKVETPAAATPAADMEKHTAAPAKKTKHHHKKAAKPVAEKAADAAAPAPAVAK